jgi:hypothetical protein
MHLSGASVQSKPSEDSARYTRWIDLFKHHSIYAQQHSTIMCGEWRELVEWVVAVAVEKRARNCARRRD